MATANFSGSYGKYGVLDATWSLVSQDKVNNRSVIRVEVKLRGTTSNAWIRYQTDTRPLKITGGGINVTHQAAYNFSGTTNVLLYSNTFTINHDSNGYKSFTLSVNFPINFGNYGSATVNQTVTLPRIARASTGYADGSFYFGDTMRIDVEMQSSGFTHTVRYQVGSKSGTIASNQSGAVTWDIPLDLSSQAGSNRYATATIYIDTYSGSSKIGTTSFTKIINVQANSAANKPKIGGITLSEGNSAVKRVLNSTDHFVNNVSTIIVNFSGVQAENGASIVSYEAEVENYGSLATSSTGAVSIPLTSFNSGPGFVRARVRDNRGGVSDWVIANVTILEYFAPVLKFDVTRTGTLKDQLTINRNAKIAPLKIGKTQKNTMKLTFSAQKAGAKTSTVDNGPATGNWSSVSELVNSKAVLANNYPLTSTYTITGTLEDQFTRTSYTVTVTTDKVALSYDNHNRVGVGKVPEFGKDGSLDVAGDIYANGKLIQQYQLTSNSGSWPYERGRDLDLVRTAGIFQGDQLKNAPTDEGAVIYTGQGNGWGEQIFVDRIGGKLFTRTLRANVWGSWIEYAPKSDIDDLRKETVFIDTGWKATGLGNCDWRRIGSVMYVRINNIGVTAGKSQALGRLGYPPSINSMFTIGDWSVSGDTVKVQVNPNDGGATILGASIKTSRNVSAQFSYPID